jgi:hypothetical protein
LLPEGAEAGIHLIEEVERKHLLLIAVFLAGQVEESSQAKQGGLTLAFKAPGKSRGTGGNEVSEGPHVAQPSTSLASDTPLGRSPSKNFVSANHLLNFQYDRSRVRVTILQLPGPIDMV